MDERELGLELLLGGTVIRISRSINGDSLVIQNAEGKTWLVRPMLFQYAEPEGMGKLDISPHNMRSD